VFVFIRASGERGKDSRYTENFIKAGELGFLRGSYHYLCIERTKEQQVADFMDIYQKGELPPVVDVEDAGLSAALVKSFVDTIKARTGEQPIIYTRKSFWDVDIGAGETWAKAHDLWVAHYTNPDNPNAPLVPGIWNGDWRFWQYSGSGTIPGIAGQVDLNVFNGTADDLANYAASSPQQPPPPAGEHVHQDLLDRIAALEARVTALEQALAAQPQEPVQLRVTAGVLSIRSGTTTSDPVVGYLYRGQVVTGFRQDPVSGWWSIGEGRWASGKYLERV